MASKCTFNGILREMLDYIDELLLDSPSVDHFSFVVIELYFPNQLDLFADESILLLGNWVYREGIKYAELGGKLWK